MNIAFSKILTLLICIFFSNSLNIKAALVSGTLIQTTYGLVPIEQLHVNDQVITYYSNKSLGLTRITKIAIETTDIIIAIETEKGSFCTSKEQLLYDPICNQWIQAQDLTVNNVFINYNLEHCKCLNIQCYNKPTTVYQISLESPHTLFISDLQILTHNFVPLVLGVSFVFGLGEGFALSSIGAGIGAFGLGLWKYFKDRQEIKLALFNNGNQHNQNRESQNQKSNQQSGSGQNNKERRTNTITKKEFFEKMKDQYEYWQDGIYKRKSRADGIKNAEYLKWDHLHNDVEAYSKSEVHLGSIDPANLTLYKPGVPGRRF